MQVKTLFDIDFRIVGVMNGDTCLAEDFIANGEASTMASRNGLLTILEYVAGNGLQNIPSAWVHEANKENGIYEFIKGRMRLFFFKGQGKEIVICTLGGIKKGQKADKAAVAASIEFKKQYIAAIDNGTYEVIKDENQ